MPRGPNVQKSLIVDTKKVKHKLNRSSVSEHNISADKSFKEVPVDWGEISFLSHRIHLVFSFNLGISGCDKAV